MGRLAATVVLRLRFGLPNRTLPRDYDAQAYKWRHLIENYFAKIKEFRGIAARYDKTDCSYAANWNLVAALIASR